MDDADFAQQRIEADLARAIEHARGTLRYATHCPDCGEALTEQRRHYGRCVGCQREREGARR